MRKPNFLIVGAQKCGTTSLHHYLSQHPDIFCSKNKELHYFDNFYRSRSAESYIANFASAGSSKLLGESTPIYLFYPGCAEKIFDFLGSIKIIILVREPISRTYSHYWHEVKLGWEDLSFEKAIMREKSLGKENDIYYRHYSYIGRSLYSQQIKKYQEVFGEENVGIFKFEDLIADPLKISNQVISFIDSSLFPLVNIKMENKNKSRIPLFQTYNRVAGKIEESIGENWISRLIRLSNSVTRKYPPLEFELATRLGDHIYTIDEDLEKIYPRKKY